MSIFARRRTFALVLALVPALALAAGCGSGGGGGGHDAAQVPAPVGPAKNVVFMMGDGMGKEHIAAGRILKNGPDVPLDFEALSDGPPASIRTFSLDTTAPDDLLGATDSAAAATAFATGRKVANGNTGALPTGEDLLTILELAQFYGKSTGLITTSYATDASPAAFYAEATSRQDDATIIRNLIQETLPNVVMGGGLATWNTFGAIEQARFVGYTAVTRADELAEIDPATLPGRLPTGPGLVGIFRGNLNVFPDSFLPIDTWTGEAMSLEADRIDRPGAHTDPRLPDMVRAALGVLERNPEGFFLFVENEHTDGLSHFAGLESSATQKEITRFMVHEVALLDEAFGVVLDWIERRGVDDTLVIVGADHECGGFDFGDKPGGGPYARGDVVDGRFTSLSLHTNAEVSFFATGPGSERVLAARELKDIYFAMQWAYTRYEGLLFPRDFADRF